MNSMFSFMKDVASEFLEIGEKVEALLYEQVKCSRSGPLTWRTPYINKKLTEVPF
ncbi:hypothetical protein [Halobacillus trueperi]|uniref:hypothetical protein n=1 Tax=Halobacillus trueperi TaxID=156205 RepID=UPI00142DB02F|nr:hypothetical protein [Halobacillus trueperi]